MPDDHFSERPIFDPVPFALPLEKPVYTWTQVGAMLGVCVATLLFGTWMFAPSARNAASSNPVPTFNEFMETAGASRDPFQPRVNRLKGLLHQKMTISEFRTLGLGTPDKSTSLSHREATTEFGRPVDDTEILIVTRFYPFETTNGPAYRVNMLWKLAVQDAANLGDRCYLATFYFRSPN